MKSPAMSVAIVIAALYASSTPASPVLSIGSATTGPNGTATVALEISGLGNDTALGTFDVNVGFDPSLVSFNSVIYGDPRFGDQLNFNGSALSATSTGAGTAELFELSLDSPSQLTAAQLPDFTLATVTFSGVAFGRTPLGLSVNALGDQNGNSLPALLQNGFVTVSAVPEPSILSLLLSGLGILGVREYIRKMKRGSLPMSRVRT